MSGFGMPFFTVSARTKLPSVVAESFITLPEFIASWNGGRMIKTSYGSPFAASCFVPTPVPYRTLTLLPVLDSKPGSIFSKDSFMGRGLSTRISVCAKAAKAPPNKRQPTINGLNNLFIDPPGIGQSQALIHCVSPNHKQLPS